MAEALSPPPARRRGRYRRQTPEWLRPGWRPPEPERWSTRLIRLYYGLYPCYLGTGARLTYMSNDCREIHIRVPRSWRTRNLLGTTFGGSMFAAMDPVHVVLLMRNLGPEYVVWDREATIRFRRPGTETLHARFVVTAEELDGIRAELERERWTHRSWVVELVDREGRVYAVLDKKIYARKRHDSE